jgi:hypothetical protein
VRHAALAFAALLLLGCAPQQLAANVNEGAPVCAVKAGQRQSYWNEEAARRDGALVVLAGECPAQPNSEGGGGGSGGM